MAKKKVKISKPVVRTYIPVNRREGETEERWKRRSDVVNGTAK